MGIQCQLHIREIIIYLCVLKQQTSQIAITYLCLIAKLHTTLVR